MNLMIRNERGLPNAWIVSSHLECYIYGATCLGGVMAILRDCGSLDLGSIPGPGLTILFTFL